VSAKLSVLRASQRLLRRGGRLAFFTISSAAGLSPADRRRAVAAGPPELDGPHVSDLLRRAGFVAVREVDVTADYLTTTRAWRTARLRHRDTVRPIGPAMYDERLAKGERAIEAIESGLLRRTLHIAGAT
jgi:cyclopropane fatty-acyl-phospholipid synthase-like methyltransferase